MTGRGGSAQVLRIRVAARVLEQTLSDSHHSAHTQQADNWGLRREAGQGEGGCNVDREEEAYATNVPEQGSAPSHTVERARLS